MTEEPVRRGADWWAQQPGGTWLRWDGQAWRAEPTPPPPPGPGEVPVTSVTGVRAGYRSLTPLWKVVVGFLIGSVVLDAIAVLSDVMVLGLLSRIAARRFVTIAEVDATFARQGVIGISQFVALLVTGILFIIWLYRATRNVLGLGTTNLRYGPGWAIGAWFIPIFSLWGPKQIINDAWRASDPDLPPVAGQAWRGGPVPGWWNAWWLAFLGSGLVGLPGAFITEASSLPEVQSSVRFTLSADALSLVAGILAALVVRAASHRQMARAQRLGFEPGGSMRFGLPSVPRAL